MPVDECCEIRDVPREQRRVLHAVLALNAAMFLVESVAGLVSHSTALLGDSLDMLGDALVYGFSLYVIGRGHRWQARAALLKGTIMAAFGAAVLAQAALTLARGLSPAADVMGIVGLAALAANVVCLVLLWRHRGDDINMRSAWLCSRNDVVANVAVLLAALAVGLSGSSWPDIVIGLIIAGVFGRSALQIVRQARRAVA
ncbi:MAG TPA: cation transporter [Methylomirabilota bacterium]|jgi:Co/Zn/Cd efflux system component